MPIGESKEEVLMQVVMDAFQINNWLQSLMASVSP
jgi:hypothetical protein